MISPMGGWSAVGVRRAKAASFSGCKSHPATIAPAGSSRSSHGGDEMAEAFGIACHELVSLDFRCGSTTDSRDLPLSRPVLVISRHGAEGVGTSACSHDLTFSGHSQSSLSNAFASFRSTASRPSVSALRRRCLPSVRGSSLRMRVPCSADYMILSHHPRGSDALPRETNPDPKD